ncbi:hypothetical protein K505DRAFT_386323 [Melanomma pulvis-pyrius CBS 109.77]|uniref:Oxidoreductase acuF-like C2H2 type zinc-finger domain-containing protein n=1 Tax=Melanomma pulvis-pyrius CBS 109.77 TaxID=1314802 RepID=A0A6A6X9P3_9PLEO|nr:hypothetical protein K505DRAFT_386323 [Melanomma pulvis-pyrius CBS 109.77]
MESVENSEASTISSTYDECLVTFRSLLANLNRTSCRNPTKALEGYCRLRTWGEEARASWPPKSRGSLDDTLRKRQDLKLIALEIIATLQRQLELDDSERRTVEISDSESNSEDDEDEENDEDEEHAIKSPKLSAVLRHIASNIKTLFLLSDLIHRPGFEKQHIHSNGEGVDDPVIAPYADFDLHCVQETLHHWNYQQEGIEVHEDTTTPKMIEGGIAQDFIMPMNQKVLMQRLARANTTRREQLLYWSRNPNQPSGFIDPAIDSDVLNVPSFLGHGSEESRSSEQAVDPFNPVLQKESEEIIYTPSAVRNKLSNRVPDVPKAAQDGPHFECPYCHVILESDRMQNRNQWQHHVFRDLRPYICTFEECQNPDKQYSTRHDWIYHERQMHRRQWVCKEHNAKFPTQDLFVEHIGEVHSKSMIKNEQLSVLLQISERQVDDTEIMSCPLCPDKLRLMELESHLAEKLESISLLALSSSVQDNMETTETQDVAPTSAIDASSISTGLSKTSEPSIDLDTSRRQCSECGHEWSSGDQSQECPACSSDPTFLLNMLPYTMDDEEEDYLQKREYKPTNGIIGKIGFLFQAIFNIKRADSIRRENLPDAKGTEYSHDVGSFRNSLFLLELQLETILEFVAFRIEIAEMRENPLHEIWHDEAKEGLMHHAMKDTYETYFQLVKEVESSLIEMGVALGLANEDIVGSRSNLLSRFKY